MMTKKSGFNSRHRQDIFLLSSIQTGGGSYPASYPMDIEALSMRVKQAEHEAHHSPPCSVEVKYAPTSSYFFMVWCLIEQTENFAFIFTLAYNG
jgi:hypothetical protein